MSDNKKPRKKQNDHPKEKPRRQYSAESMQLAVISVRNQEMGYREASRNFGVPKTTLRDIIQGRVPEQRRAMGPMPYLSIPGEGKILQWVLNCAKSGFPVKGYQLQNTVQKIVSDSGITTPFKDNKPGKTWLKLFLERNPEISQRVAESISRGRAVLTEECLRKWSAGLREFLESTGDEDILDDPLRILNGDEIGFSICPKTGKVLGPKGWTNVYEIKMGNEKETITVLFFFNANGDMAPPMIVYPYKRIPSDIVNSVPEDWVIANSDSGWVRSECVYEYMVNDFDDWVDVMQIKKPVLALVDGHKSHLTMHLSQGCDDRGIILYALPPNSTHILQPCDVSVFRPLKQSWKKTVADWQSRPENANSCLTKLTFAPLLAETLKNSSLEDAIKNGFKTCGIYPFNPDAVDYTKCVQNKLEQLNSSPVSSQSGQESNPASDLEKFQDLIKNIAPQLSTKGIDVNILNEEIRRAYSQTQKVPSREIGGDFDDQAEQCISDQIEAEMAEVGHTESVNPGHNGLQQQSSPTILIETSQSDIPEQEDDLNSGLQQENCPVKANGTSLVAVEGYENELTRGQQEEDSPLTSIKPTQKSSNSKNGSLYAKWPNMEVMSELEPPTELILVDPLPNSSEPGNLHDLPGNPASPTTSHVEPTSDSLPQNKSTPLQDSTNFLQRGRKVQKNSLLSAFDSHLFYPQPIQYNKKTLPNERPPSAVSSAAWRAYYRKKDDEKNEQEAAKQARIEERKRKKDEKEMLVKIKKEKLEEVSSKQAQPEKNLMKKTKKEKSGEALVKRAPAKKNPIKKINQRKSGKTSTKAAPSKRNSKKTGISSESEAQ